MMIFLLMAVLLFQAMAMLRVTQAVIEAWGRYERARAWGDREDSVERCLAVFNHFFIIFSSFQGLWLGFEALWVLFLHLARLQSHSSSARQDSLESMFCDSGYLERVACSSSPRGGSRSSFWP